jgi:glucosamine 6-phosphate synthetase-like amidotransferase/phosphosugar isomerase protein
MYADLPTDLRTRHPHHMVEEIHAQPEAVARSLTLAARDGGAVADMLRGARRVLVTGCGTSFYAAEVGAWMLRAFTGGAVDARAAVAFEPATYDLGIGSGDVVIGVTHAGTTLMTCRALERARAAGAATVTVTGFPERRAGQLADRVLATGYGDERSWAHTVSYTAALATMAALANALADERERLDLSPLPEVMRAALGLGQMVHRLAAGVLGVERSAGPVQVVLAGGGPNAATAREGALKLLETSYVQASGWDLEQILHGPLAAVTPETVAIVLAPSGRSVDRAVGLVEALKRIGADPLVITDDDAAERFDTAHRLLVPAVPEVLSPLPLVVPLQLFSYFLAVGKGLNPDLIHRDDERYRAARAAYE